jgi:putative alpha-1,2-mannosidase
MVSVSPHNSPGSSSGYVHEKEYFYGFGHNHLSGTGCADLGSIIITASKNKPTDDNEVYKVRYSGETARPGHYSIHLDDINTFAEVTASNRSGMIKFIPETEGEFNILIDLGRSLA